MDKIILTDGNTSTNIDANNGNVLKEFSKILTSICNKKQIDTFKKPDGDWKRYEQRDSNNVLVQCSFWFI